MDAAGVKFAVTQGTLAQHNIHIETHGMHEDFSPSVLGDSIPTRRMPRYFYYGENPESCRTHIEITKLARGTSRNTTKQNEDIAKNAWQYWCSDHANVRKSHLGNTIKPICDKFDVNENIIKKMLHFSNCHVSQTNTRSHSATRLQRTTTSSVKNALKHNSTVQAQFSMVPLRSLSFPQVRNECCATTQNLVADQCKLEQLNQLSWEELATTESKLYGDVWEPKRLK